MDYSTTNELAAKSVANVLFHGLSEKLATSEHFFVALEVKQPWRFWRKVPVQRSGLQRVSFILFQYTADFGLSGPIGHLLSLTDILNACIIFNI